MSSITTHVLDTSAGRPAGGVTVTLSRLGDGERWTTLGTRDTDTDGRARDLLSSGVDITAGTYRLRFAVGAYFAARDIEAFYPYAEVTFVVRDPRQHHHVPLLVSPFGYTTYRGS